jgi:hypothetical protein
VRTCAMDLVRAFAQGTSHTCIPLHGLTCCLHTLFSHLVCSTLNPSPSHLQTCTISTCISPKLSLLARIITTLHR